MCDDKVAVIDDIMRECGMPLWGVASFAAIKGSLIQCGSLRRLPENSRSVIAAVFPYYCTCPSGEISRYAMPIDYHIVVGDMLKRAAFMLREQFDFSFEPFCDASPIPEVAAARLAGLGALGKNGLLITPRFGSFVFIGEIVTDLLLPPNEKPGGNCISCGRCTVACPSGAITPSGIDKTRCVSHLTQKKGSLTPDEQLLIKKAGTIWGCDICQNICFYNISPEATYIDEFKKDLVCSISCENVDNENFEKENANRAFIWRGKEVLKRNIGILHGAPDNNSLDGR